jgi:Putative transposase
MDDHAVVFRTRGDETSSLPPTEFIGRFLQHILPKGFVKIRPFGLMSSGNVSSKLERARALLPSVDTDLSDEASDDHDGDQLPLSPGSLAPDLAHQPLSLPARPSALCWTPATRPRSARISCKKLPPAPRAAAAAGRPSTKCIAAKLRASVSSNSRLRECGLRPTHVNGYFFCQLHSPTDPNRAKLSLFPARYPFGLARELMGEFQVSRPTSVR